MGWSVISNEIEFPWQVDDLYIDLSEPLKQTKQGDIMGEMYDYASYVRYNNRGDVEHGWTWSSRKV